MKIRCFFCMELPQEIKENLQKWMIFSREEAPDLKWVKSNALHITLKFCGEIQQTQVEDIIKKFGASLLETDICRFRITLSGFGAFPNLRRPRVLWIGIEDGQQELNRLYSLINKNTASEGIAEERTSFHPHVTVARVRRNSVIPVSFLSKCNHEPLSFGTWKADTITFMQSDLKRQGPVYTTLASFKLE